MTYKPLEPLRVKKIPIGTDLVLEVLETRWNRRNTEIFDTKMYGKTYGDKVCLKCTLCQGHYDFSFSDFYFIFVCCVEASK